MTPLACVLAVLGFLARCQYHGVPALWLAAAAVACACLAVLALAAAVLVRDARGCPA